MTEQKWESFSSAQNLANNSSFSATEQINYLMYERTAFGSRVVPANSIAKMHARFLPLLMRMYNWYSDDPDPTFILLYFFYSREPSGNQFSTQGSRPGTTNTM